MAVLATEKQILFIRKLVSGRDTSSLDVDLAETLKKVVAPNVFGVVTKAEASDLITVMVDLPKKPKAQQTVLDGVPKPKKGHTDWSANGPQVIIKKLSVGEVTRHQAAAELSVSLAVIDVRLKWYRKHGTSVMPEYVRRRVKTHSGIEVLVPAEYGDVTQHEIDWVGFFGIEKYERFDLRVICAMFYASERLVTAEKIGSSLQGMRGAAQRYISTWAERFAKYTLAACLGEFRHRRKKGTLHLVPMDRRHEARAGCQRAAEYLWTKGEETAIKATQYMVDTFKDHSFFPGGGYGGPKWSCIAATLLAYLEKKMPDVVFADYVWDLSHNGGRFFDKCPLFQKENETRALLDAKKVSKVRDVLPWAGKYLHVEWRGALDTLEAINWKEGDPR